MYIDTRLPYEEQESEELGDGVIIRLNPTTDDIENIEVMYFSARLLRKELFDLPVIAELRRVS